MSDLELIQDPNQWILYPYLPLRKNGKPGVLLAGGTTVYDHNVFDLIEKQQPCKVLKQYPTHQAILDDGWYVD